MTFDDWCNTDGIFLNDSDSAARVAKLMARKAWEQATLLERKRCESRAIDFAQMMEDGAGEPEPGYRFRQLARSISAGDV